MNSNEFTRICRELYQFSESIGIETNKNYVKFYVSSEVMGGSVKIEANPHGEKEEYTVLNVSN
jgi:hypothetical protein